MKKGSLKKFFAFIIILTILSALPELVSAQTLKKCTPQGKCPKGYYCASGYCVKIWPGCTRCPYFFLTGGSPANDAVSISSASSNAFSFQLMQAQNVSAKIYDATGRLVKTFADKVFEKGEHKLQWDATGIKAGIYIVQFNAGAHSETKKIAVIK